MISYALQPSVVVRSLKVAFVVGTLLILINHGDRLASSGFDYIMATKILLTYLVPYLVATYGAVSAMMDMDTN